MLNVLVWDIIFLANYKCYVIFPPTEKLVICTNFSKYLTQQSVLLKEYKINQRINYIYMIHFLIYSFIGGIIFKTGSIFVGPIVAGSIVVGSTVGNPILQGHLVCKVRENEKICYLMLTLFFESKWSWNIIKKKNYYVFESGWICKFWSYTEKTVSGLWLVSSCRINTWCAGHDNFSGTPLCQIIMPRLSCINSATAVQW